MLRSRTWLYEGSIRREHQASQPSSGGAQGGHAQEGANVMPDLNRYEKDETLQHPRCVFQLLKNILRVIRPRWSSDIVGSPKNRSCGQPRRIAAPPDRIKLARSAMPWDGRSILQECRSFAAPPSFNSYWATWADPAVAFSHFAVMHPFKVRPMFRHSSTFFRDI